MNFPMLLLFLITLLTANMETKTIQQKEFSVIGIAARTSNVKEMSGKGIIGAQWSRFFTESILDKIPNKADSNILGV